jgi:mercuric ion transport protein
MTNHYDLVNPARKASALPRQRANTTTWLSLGGVLAGLGAASCCVVPFLLFAAGIGGAWIANLTALEPYQFYFAGVAIGCIGFGFYRVYRRLPAECAEDSYCAGPVSHRIAKLGLWSATAIVLVALVSPYFIARWL